MDLKLVPPNFLVTTADKNKVVMVNKAYQAVAQEVMDNLESLKARSGSQFSQGRSPASVTVQGRAKHWVLDVNKGGVDRIIVRRYVRGGLINRWLLGDLLWGVNRPIKELSVTESGRERQAPVPEILSLRLHRAWGPFWRADIIFKEIPETVDLYAVIMSLEKLTDQPRRFHEEKKKIIKAVAEAVRSLHQAGVWHQDMQLRNILIRKQADQVRAYTIDLDRSKFFEKLSFSQKVNNLVRLYRSIEKWGIGRGVIRISDRCRLLKEYFRDQEFTRQKRWVISNRCEFNLKLHKLWWSVSRMI
ncbi:MAG: hypothetical protein KAI63_01125 [Planctomycetes bacterium]|nr:hypothetical protein [Planctomycetota bacterium]